MINRAMRSQTFHVSLTKGTKADQKNETATGESFFANLFNLGSTIKKGGGEKEERDGEDHFD